MRGFPNLITTVGMETLIGGGNWFTQSLRASPLLPTAFGQVEYDHQRARINWLLNHVDADETALLKLLDNLAIETGLHGAKFILASAPHEHKLFRILRHAGYCVYGWEKFWEVDNARLPAQIDSCYKWSGTIPADCHDLLKFQRKHLSAAVRSVTPLADEVLPNFILRSGENINGYAIVHTFNNKLVVYPVMESSIDHPTGIIAFLLNKYFNDVPIRYITQTTNHDWLERSLSEIAAPVTVRRELLVKYFAVAEKLPIGILNHSAEGRHPDPVAPFLHSSKPQDNL